MAQIILVTQKHLPLEKYMKCQNNVIKEIMGQDHNEQN